MRIPLSCSVMASVVMAVFCAPCLRAQQAEPPDPVALLRGVQSARESIVSGRIEMSVHRQQLVPFANRSEATLTFSFNEEKRTVREKARVLTFIPMSNDDASKLRSQLQARGGDVEELVKKGLARWRDSETILSWDGSQLSQHSPTGDGTMIKDPRQNGQLAFDPRLLGITPSHLLSETFSSCLGFEEKGAMVTMVGRDSLNGVSTWHVLVKTPGPQQVKSSGMERHFWVEDTRLFRVHRHIYVFTLQRIQVDSSYDQIAANAILPSKVVTTSYVNDQKKNISTFEVTKAELNAAVDLTTGTMAALGIPVGYQMYDERRKADAGYWNGEGLSQGLVEAVAADQLRQQAIERRRLIWRWSGISAAIAAAALCSFITLRRLRNRRPPQSN